MTTSRRPVAVVTSTVPVTLNTFHRELIRQLSERFEVHVVTSPGRHLDLLAEDLPVTVHPVTMARDISLASDAGALIAWVRLLRRLRPSLLVTATPKASLLGQLAGAALRVRSRLYYVGGLRLEGTSGPRRAVLYAMERLTSACATIVVANSPSLAREYRRLGLAPLAKLHQTRPGSSHGVDAAHFAPRAADAELARQLGIDTSRPVVGFVGRLTHDKGVDTLLEAVELLATRRPGTQWLVVGDQTEPDSSRYLDDLRAARADVVTVDAVDDVRPFMALMTVHALPSLREGFPNVVLEASAMALPTVTTDATGAIDSVRHEVTGLLVEAADGPQFADAVERLLADPELASRLGSAARSWVQSEFSPPDVVRSLLAPALGTAT